MTDLSRTTIANGIATILITEAPVNALSVRVRRAIMEALADAAAHPDVQATVLTTGARTFFPGADISEFGRPFEEPDLNEVVNAAEDCGKPVIAAIYGTALGGGLEVALGAHYRIADAKAKLGLPEVTLGLIPGAGGTQRLPRVMDAVAAIDLITTGKPLSAQAALEAGLIDRIAQGDLLPAAQAFARELAAEGSGPRRLSDAPLRVSDEAALAAKLDTLAGSPRPARRAAAAALRAAREMPFAQALARERMLFDELVQGAESQALRYLFFAERAAGQVPGLARDVTPLAVEKVGVIGAGTMGGGIAMNFLNIGVPVTIVETSEAALERGVRTIRRNYEATAKKGRMTAEDVEKRMALLNPVLSYDALADVDLVIEAAFESMPVKKEIFARLDAVTKPSAILASNTSFLDVDEIAAATKDPSRVLGLHFFSPANVMRLLEIVRARETAPRVLATALAVARKIGKLAVVAGVCYGFIANRVMDARRREAERALLAGATPAAVDRLLLDYGFPMGQFAMFDLVGLDVMGRDSAERTIMGELVAKGRLGQKSGGGYYDYDENRKATPSEEAIAIIRAFAADLGVAERPAPADLLQRVLAPVVNEGAKLLEEGIAYRASDIDVALSAGYGWPAHSGGPMFWADVVGLPAIIATLETLKAESGIAEHEPAALLRELAAGGKPLHGWAG